MSIEETIERLSREAGMTTKRIDIGGMTIIVGKQGKHSDDDDNKCPTLPQEPLEGEALISYLKQMETSAIVTMRQEAASGGSITRALATASLGDAVDRAMLQWAVDSYQGARRLYGAIATRVAELEPGHDVREIPDFTLIEALALLAKARKLQEKKP